MRRWFSGALALTLACGDSGGGSTGEPTTSGTTSGTTSSGTSASTGASSTGEPTTGGTIGATGSSGSTTESTTSTSGVSSTSEGSSSGGPGSTGTSGASEGSSSGSTGDTGGQGGSCEKDADCQLLTDCCTCDVGAPGDPLPACPIMECFVEKCGTVDIGDPVCRFGRCTFSKIHCNPTSVLCKSLPPECPPGEVPSVDENAACWTGQCAPVETCDWAPNCEACKLDNDPLVCVFKAQKGAYNVCEPKPAACGDVPDIDCGCGQEICDASPPHTVCHDKMPGITCECPFC